MKSTSINQNEAKASYTAWQLVLMVLTVILVALYAARPLFNVDVFWHLELGEWITTHKAIPKTDMFSAVHPESSWVQFQWLWELLAYLLVSSSGITSLRVFQVVILTATFVALFGTFYQRTKGTALALFLVIFALLLYEERFQARPDALNLLFFTAVLSFSLKPPPQKRIRMLLSIFVVCMVWSNIHAGSAVLAAAVFGAAAIGGTIQHLVNRSNENPTIRWAWTCLATCVVGLISNPIFFSGWYHFIEIYPAMRATGNWEWEPTYRMTANGLHPYFIFLSFAPSVVALVYLADLVTQIRRKDQQPIAWGETVLCIGLLLLAHQASRNAVLATFPLAFSLPRLCSRLEIRKLTLSLLLSATLLLCISYAYRIEHVRGGLIPTINMLSYDLEPTAYPEELGAFLSEAGIEGKILNQGKWGGYLIWSSWPQCRVFVDTRHHLNNPMWETYYSFHNPQTRADAANRAADNWGLDLIAFSGPTFPFQQPPKGWELLFKAGPQELYLRTNSANAEKNRLRALEWAGAQRQDPRHSVAAAVIPQAAQRWLGHPFNKSRLTEAQATIGKDPSGKSERTIGGILAQAGAYIDARPYLVESSRLSPNNVRTWYWLALIGWHTEDRNLLAHALTKLANLPLNKLAPVERIELAMLSSQSPPGTEPIRQD